METKRKNLVSVYRIKNFVVLFINNKIVDYYQDNLFREGVRQSSITTVAWYKKVKKYNSIQSEKELTKKDIKELHKYNKKCNEYYNQFRTIKW